MLRLAMAPSRQRTNEAIARGRIAVALEELPLRCNDLLVQLSPRVAELPRLRLLSVKKCHRLQHPESLERLLPNVAIDR